jgi:hypothetical protein
LVVIDEDRAWPAVQEFIASSSGYRLGKLIALLTPERRQIALRAWVEKGADYKWYADQQVDSVLSEPGFNPEERDELLQRIEKQVSEFRWKTEDKVALLRKLRGAVSAT